jgi:hypothetical protein
MQYWPFAKYQLSDGSPLVSMVSIDKNVKFPLSKYTIFLKSMITGSGLQRIEQDYTPIYLF